MPRFVDIQSNFTTGELDPLLRARVDLQQYNNALSKATNVVIQPQGGLRRRPGTKHILELPNTSTESAGNGVRLVPFEFSVDDSYMLCFTHQRMYIIKNGVVQANINGGGLSYLAVSSITSAMLDDMCWTQSADTLIVVHPDLQPLRITRTSDSAWTAATITFDSIPKYAFELDSHIHVGSKLSVSAVSGNVELTATNTHNTSGTAQAGSANTITLKSASSATNDIYVGMFIEITSGTGVGQSRLCEDYNGTTKVLEVHPAWTTAPDNTSQYEITSFKAAAVNQYINAQPQGRARIVEVLSDTKVRAVTEYPFFSTSDIDPGKWEVEHGYEDVWSSAKGWPRSVTFHEGRLYFGGSKSRPATIWASRIGLFFDFQPTESLDDDALEATLETNQLNVIVDMISGRDLQVFTTGAEFFVPQAGTEPITPTTIAFKAVSRNGTKLGTRVQTIETGTVYVQRQGKALNEFLYSDTQATYVTQRISLLAGHLLKNPYRLALRRATSTDEGDLLLSVNEQDGTMAVFSVLRSQQITAPSEYTTDGLFLDVNVDVTNIYTVTRRTFNGVNRYFIELFDNALFTDCAFIGGSAGGVGSGLPHIGKSLNVITDGVPQSNETVTSGGAVTFDRASTTSYEVGLPISVYVKTMPVEVKLQTGTRMAFKKRIVEINAIVDDTQHMQINNNPVPFRTFDNPLLDEPVPEFTGIKRVNGVLGYDREQAIEVSQNLPLKMTLLGLEYKVAVSGGT
jgi:hypothetical protein